MWQEPGSNNEIKAFCEKNYGVSFPVMEKITVKGRSKHPVYAFLTDANKNGVKSSSVTWNFQKSLIDEEGQLVDVISPHGWAIDGHACGTMGSRSDSSKSVLKVVKSQPLDGPLDQKALLIVVRSLLLRDSIDK